MEEREISYERTIYNSYMKIFSELEESFDERLILMKTLEGAIPCEKSYINGRGQYWYDITGKQALDNFCKVNVVEGQFLEHLLLSICNILELLEWNLIDERCLKLEPEMIFVNHTGEEIAFVLYPEEESADTFAKIRMLMEYLLTKVDHTEKSFVSWIYEIYEYLVNGDYSIADLKNKILQKRIQELEVQEIERTQLEQEAKEEIEDTFEGSPFSEEMVGVELKEILRRGVQKLIKVLEGRKPKLSQKESPLVVYPEEEEITEQVKIHPTICMTTAREEAKGLLVYEGIEGYPNFEIGTLVCVIGKSHRVKLQIERDTISQFHARIEYQEGEYYIEDMNSTNGTYVNEEMLNYKEKRALQPGDIVQFADVRYRFW